MDNKNTYADLAISHYESNWGTDYQLRRWQEGPMPTLSRQFHILEFPPHAKRSMWTYATCGMSSLDDLKPVELHIFSPQQDHGLLEILTAVSYYHMTEAKLDLHHTVNFGVPWKGGSECSYGLISLPYLDGPGLELLKLSKSLTAHFYWLIPITKEEVDYKKEHGIEALERLFDNPSFNYLDPYRKSVA